MTQDIKNKSVFLLVISVLLLIFFSQNINTLEDSIQAPFAPELIIKSITCDQLVTPCMLEINYYRGASSFSINERMIVYEAQDSLTNAYFIIAYDMGSNQRVDYDRSCQQNGDDRGEFIVYSQLSGEFQPTRYSNGKFVFLDRSNPSYAHVDRVNIYDIGRDNLIGTADDTISVAYKTKNALEYVYDPVFTGDNIYWAVASVTPSLEITRYFACSPRLTGNTGGCGLTDIKTIVLSQKPFIKNFQVIEYNGARWLTLWEQYNSTDFELHMIDFFNIEKVLLRDNPTPARIKEFTYQPQLFDVYMLHLLFDKTTTSLPYSLPPFTSTLSFAYTPQRMYPPLVAEPDNKEIYIPSYNIISAGVPPPLLVWSEYIRYKGIKTQTESFIKIAPVDFFKSNLYAPSIIKLDGTPVTDLSAQINKNNVLQLVFKYNQYPSSLTCTFS